MTHFDPNDSVLAGMNHTELYQCCTRAGILVRPNEPREAMIAYLEGLQDPPGMEEADNVFHGWRIGIIGFLSEYWESLATQITCPAKDLKGTPNPNPRPCFGCLDTQVVSCIVQNSNNERLISQHRIVRKK